MSAQRVEVAAPVAGGAPGSVGATGERSIELDDLILAIEERVLADLERRGGRYLGRF